MLNYCVILSAVFVKSMRGNTMVSFGGYTFSYKKHYKGKGIKKRWVCSTNYCFGCKAVVYTIDNVIVNFRNEHNHELKGKRKQFKKAN